MPNKSQDPNSDPSALYNQLTMAFTQARWHESKALAARLMSFSDQHAGVHGIAGVICVELGHAMQIHRQI